MAVIRKKRRVRRAKKGSNKMYFHQGTHDAIAKYQNLDDASQKEDLYVKEILPAFNKLVENLIFIHGFAKINGSYEDLKSDCVTFLYETIKKFDPNRGTKAFSYFNVVAKNWLIIKSKQKIKSNKRHVCIDDLIYLSERDIQSIENYGAIPAQDTFIIEQEAKDNMFKMMREIKKRLTGDNELACIDAIITLFEKIEDLDLLNKRAVFVYMRDLSSLNPKQLSTAMSVIRKHYKALVKHDEYDIFF